MGDDDGVPIRIPIFGMAAPLGYEFKAVNGEDGDELGGWDSLGHGLAARSSDGEFSHGDVRDLRDDGGFGEVFEVKLQGLLEVGEGFLFGGTETGHVVVEALGHVVRLFSVKRVMETSHYVKSREESAG